jgi:hypothetical protein
MCAQCVFGSGDYYRSVTLTANRHFALSAKQQGINIPCYIHESRVLSEQKQASAVPTATNCDMNYLNDEFFQTVE